MTAATPNTFDASDLITRLAAMSDAELDALPYGVVEMDAQRTVLRYNSVESRYSGLAPDMVVGRHFFRDVAPCSDNRHVAHLYDSGTLDKTIPYTFSLRMKPVPVTLRMLKAPGVPMYLLVLWQE